MCMYLSITHFPPGLAILTSWEINNATLSVLLIEKVGKDQVGKTGVFINLNTVITELQKNKKFYFL